MPAIERSIAVLMRPAMKSMKSRAAVLFIAIMGISTAPPSTAAELENAERPLTPIERQRAAAGGFEEVRDSVHGRCSMCHARAPVWEGVHWAPKGVVLETSADLARGRAGLPPGRLDQRHAARQPNPYGRGGTAKNRGLVSKR